MVDHGPILNIHIIITTFQNKTLCGKGPEKCSDPNYIEYRLSLSQQPLGNRISKTTILEEQTNRRTNRQTDLVGLRSGLFFKFSSILYVK